MIGSGTTSRLKQMGMEFTVWVFKHVRALRFNSILANKIQVFFFALLQRGGKRVGIIMLDRFFFFEIYERENSHMFGTLHFVPLNILENG